jgi:hypothetical protein
LPELKPPTHPARPGFTDVWRQSMVENANTKKTFSEGKGRKWTIWAGRVMLKTDG